MNIDEFLTQYNIELFPFQREVLDKVLNGEKIYVLYPPQLSRTNAKLFFQTMLEIMYRTENETKGEDNG